MTKLMNNQVAMIKIVQGRVVIWKGPIFWSRMVDGFTPGRNCKEPVAVSIVDVARRAGVSKSTVSRVVTRQARVHPTTRLRVEQAIRELGYRPNGVARGLVHGRTRTLGLVVFDLPNPYFGLLTRGVEAAARARGYNVLIGDSAGSVAQQQECLAMLAERR